MLIKAVLGGGCFWCLDAGMQNLKGVEKIQPAYAGGPEQNPNYKQVCSGKTGHAEVVVIDFDATILGYFPYAGLKWTVRSDWMLKWLTPTFVIQIDRAPLSDENSERQKG